MVKVADNTTNIKVGKVTVNGKERKMFNGEILPENHLACNPEYDILPNGQIVRKKSKK